MFQFVPVFLVLDAAKDIIAALGEARARNQGHIVVMIEKSEVIAADHSNTLVDELVALQAKSNFTAALSLTELLNLHGYINKFPGRKVYMLGQMWDRWPMCGTEAALPTLIKNMGLVFSPVSWR